MIELAIPTGTSLVLDEHDIPIDATHINRHTAGYWKVGAGGMACITCFDKWAPTGWSNKDLLNNSNMFKRIKA
jgi:hypothetical protein